jgi:hypothetical protein
MCRCAVLCCALQHDAAAAGAAGLKLGGLLSCTLSVFCQRPSGLLMTAAAAAGHELDRLLGGAMFEFAVKQDP